MAKITTKYQTQALEDLKKINGKRRERIISEKQLMDLIHELEKKYQENYNRKDFSGVEGVLFGENYSKPRSYKYRAYMTTVYIKILRGHAPRIDISLEDWGYIAQYRQYNPRVIWG